MDEETGLYYFSARYLDQKTSRWLSVDPAFEKYLSKPENNDDENESNPWEISLKKQKDLPGQGGIFSPINLNLYSYSGNNPIVYKDPDGNFRKIYTNPEGSKYKYTAVVQSYYATSEMPISQGFNDYTEAENWMNSFKLETTNPMEANIDMMFIIDGAVAVRNIAKAIITGEAKNTVKRIVIGEGMDRVKDAGRAMGAKWYQAWGKYFKEGSFNLEKSLQRNKRWIESKMKQGYEILDIGPKGEKIKSAFYKLEQELIKNYNKVTKVKR